MTVAELYNRRDQLNKEILNCYDVMETELLRVRLTDINCAIIKKIIK